MSYFSIEDASKYANIISSNIYNKLIKIDNGDEARKFLKYYGINLPNSNETSIELKKEELQKKLSRKKILVIGNLKTGKNILNTIAKTNGIDEYNIEFVSYEETKTFGLNKLKLPCNYSDIIIGATPHSVSNSYGANSMVSDMINNKEQYPNVIFCWHNSGNKFNSLEGISKDFFIKAIVQTQYWKWLQELNTL